MILFLIGCSFWEDETLPPQLYGIWKTDDPRYAGSYLEIRKESIVFQTIDGDTNLNWITNIETESEPDQTLVKITYKDREGLEYLLSLYYIETKAGDIIRFKNQEKVDWTKRKEL